MIDGIRSVAGTRGFGTSGDDLGAAGTVSVCVGAASVRASVIAMSIEFPVVRLLDGFDAAGSNTTSGKSAGRRMI